MKRRFNRHRLAYIRVQTYIVFVKLQRLSLSAHWQLPTNYLLPTIAKNIIFYSTNAWERHDTAEKGIDLWQCHNRYDYYFLFLNMLASCLGEDFITSLHLLPPIPSIQLHAVSSRSAEAVGAIHWLAGRADQLTDPSPRQLKRTPLSISMHKWLFHSSNPAKNLVRLFRPFWLQFHGSLPISVDIIWVGFPRMFTRKQFLTCPPTSSVPCV